MPALTFGLGAAKPSAGGGKPALKRKAVFADAGSDDDDAASSPQPPAQAGAKKSSRPLKPLQPLAADDSSDSDASPRPTKSPKLSHSGPTYGLQKKQPAPALSENGTSKDSNKDSNKYTNLSALRSAKLHDAQASQLDASVYDYDGVYDTFRPATNKGKSKGAEAAGPKYMGNLLASTEQRKRDHERAREKAIQRERENEGDEFKDKEAFVTSGYKAQQEEMRKAEAEEAKRLEEEEEKRRRGAGMVDFNKKMLEREEERMKAIAREEERMKAIAEAEERKKMGGDEAAEEADGALVEDEDGDVDRKAKDLNEHGARIAVNEEGEVIDKRQLLTAGLNVAPKKPGAAKPAAPAKAAERPQGVRASNAQDSRQAQRERQSRMIERQMEQMMEQQQAAAEAEQQGQQEKNKSKISDNAKLSAKERYLARKREREAEAAELKKASGAG